MTDPIYKALCKKFAERGGRYPGMDIPEFYEMARTMFTPEEAAVAVAIPSGFSTAGKIAKIVGRGEAEIDRIIQGTSAIAAPITA